MDTWRHGRGRREGRTLGRHRRVFLVLLLLAFLGVVALGAVGCAQVPTIKIGKASSSSSNTTAGVTAAINGSDKPVVSDGDLTSPAEAVAAAVGPSIVNVAVEGVAQSGFGSQQFAGEGSGVILSADGYILTNNHVVAVDNGTGTQTPVDKVTVTLATGEQLPARIIGRDPYADLAVIKVDKGGLPAAQFIGNFADVKIGQYAIAIGSPLGLKNSVTLGIISGMGREIDVPAGSTEQFALVDLIQTDAAISPGNSGGALVDAKGRVIGINVAYLPPSQTGAQNLGFAIPSDYAKDVAQELIKTGQVRHAFLGIRNQTVTPELQQQFGLSRSSGVLVGGTDPGTPAAKAGLKQGDIITKIDDKTVTNDTDLYAILRRHKPGDVATVAFDRNGQEQTVQVTLGERPQ